MNCGERSTERIDYVLQTCDSHCWSRLGTGDNKHTLFPNWLQIPGSKGSTLGADGGASVDFGTNLSLPPFKSVWTVKRQRRVSQTRRWGTLTAIPHEKRGRSWTLWGFPKETPPHQQSISLKQHQQCKGKRNAENIVQATSKQAKREWPPSTTSP